jgi:hypothetical protein
VKSLGIRIRSLRAIKNVDLCRSLRKRIVRERWRKTYREEYLTSPFTLEMKLEPTEKGLIGIKERISKTPSTNSPAKSN